MTWAGSWALPAMSFSWSNLKCRLKVLEWPLAFFLLGPLQEFNWTIFRFLLFLFGLFVFLGPHLWHIEVPRLRAKSELQLLAHTTATAMPDPSHVCHLHHSSRQCRLLNWLSRASWILVGFITTESQRELLDNFFLMKKYNEGQQDDHKS